MYRLSRMSVGSNTLYKRASRVDSIRDKTIAKVSARGRVLLLDTPGGYGNLHSTMQICTHDVEPNRDVEAFPLLTTESEY